MARAADVVTAHARHAHEPELIDQAGHALGRAQARAGVRISRLHDPGEQRAAAAIWQQIWDRDGDPPISPELVRAAAHAGNYVSGAFDGDRMVGALFGFYAGESGPDHVHSHILGVQASGRGRGVGFALKLHQRLWALERGLTRINWTFDPLVRGNGFFNIVKLAAQGVDYLVDFYGSMNDSINGKDESDRVVVCWELADPVVAAACGGIVENVDASPWRAAGAVIALDSGPDGDPQRGSVDAGTLLCRVPADILDLRARAPQLAHAWRHELREVMGGAMARGLRLRTMTRDGWYVLGDGDVQQAPSSR